MALWNDTFLRLKTTQQRPQNERWETTMEHQNTYSQKCMNEALHVRNKEVKEKHPSVEESDLLPV